MLRFDVLRVECLKHTDILNFVAARRTVTYAGSSHGYHRSVLCNAVIHFTYSFVFLCTEHKAFSAMNTVYTVENNT